MKITSGTAPFLRKPRHTKHIMRELLIGLAVIFIAAVVYNFTLGVNYGFKVIGIMAVSILFTFISDLIAGSFRFNKEKDGEYADFMVLFVKENFSVVTAVIFALTVPVGTPVYVVAIGSIFATLIVKHTFGGFGSNIFNPAALGRIFLALAFGGQLKAYLPGGENLGGLTAGVTVTSDFATSGTKFITGTLSGNVSMLDLWAGKYSGALGETFTLLILVVGVVLAAREVINWRTPVFLFLTVALSSVFMALVGGVNVLEYLLLQFGLGGLVFGAIFMFTDPVTSPTSNFGKALIGVIGGFLNVLIRVAGVYPEGTAFSIALVNVFSPMIDKLIAGRTDVKLWKPYTTTGVAVALSIGLLTGLGVAKVPSDPMRGFTKYYGEHTSLPRDGATEEMTIKINVYVDKKVDLIKGIDILEGAHTDNWAEKWVESGPAILETYIDVNVYDFLAFDTDLELYGEGGAELVVGISWTPRRLFSAVQNALEGYGA